MAQNPVMPPVDRSNSPPIISSPTGTAMIPKNAACWAQAWKPVWVSHRCCGVLSVTANTTNTATAPSSAPKAGRRRKPGERGPPGRPRTAPRRCRRGRRRAVARPHRAGPPPTSSWSSVVSGGDRGGDGLDVGAVHELGPAGHGGAAADGVALVLVVDEQELPPAGSPAGTAAGPRRSPGSAGRPADAFWTSLDRSNVAIFTLAGLAVTSAWPIALFSVITALSPGCDCR